MQIIQAIKLILTLHCDEASKLRSEQFDRRLSFAERWALRLHLVGCYVCRRVRRQLNFLDQAVKQLPARTDPTPDELRQARGRIARRLRQG